MKRKRRSKATPRLRGKPAPLGESVERLAKLFEFNPAMIAIGTLDGKLLDVNLAYAEFLGYSRDEMLGKSLADLGIISAEEIQRLLAIGDRAGVAMREVEVNMRARGGDLLQVLMSANIIPMDGALYRVATLVDVTARKQAEADREKLRARLGESQRMESVGRLAGGVAHDFNNILTAINAFTRFALTGLPEGEQRWKDLSQVLAASERAERLTRQLLAFSRKQVMKPQIIDLNAVIVEIAKMLKRLIGEDVELETALAPQPCLVRVDLGQIEQVILNLAVNARDAMPSGGTLTFETRIEDSASGRPDMSGGPVVRLTARDTGCGMTDAVKAHVFEPFFTTKARGKGTGLGMSMVYGIIKQSGGEIEIESAPNRGTSFHIYLRKTDSLPRSEDDAVKREPVLQGNETVLLVEDEDPVRSVGERALTANGYTVLSASNGPEALTVLARHGKPVDALITDVVMPGMSGRELAKEIAKKKLARRTLYVSGYTDDAIAHQGGLELGIAFLDKPFTLEALLRKLRDVLDGPADRARA